MSKVKVSAVEEWTRSWSAEEGGGGRSGKQLLGYRFLVGDTVHRYDRERYSSYVAARAAADADRAAALEAHA